MDSGLSLREPRNDGGLLFFVMAGLVPAIHVFCYQDVDARHKAGHDDFGANSKPLRLPHSFNPDRKRLRARPAAHAREQLGGRPGIRGQAVFDLHRLHRAAA
jgi:hypothetical protein